LAGLTTARLSGAQDRARPALLPEREIRNTVMDLNRELTSRYADGQVTDEERLLIEERLAGDSEDCDPQAALDLDDYKLIEDLFGHVEPESISDECREHLYALDRATALDGATGAPAFERVEVPQIKRFRWGGWAAAAAAILLAFVGISQLAHKPEITLRDFARLSLDAEGEVVKTERLEAVTFRTGEEVIAGPRQRITYRDPLGARVVLMPESRLALGDPREGELLDLKSGTVLLTVYDGDDMRVVRAGRYAVRSQGAEFGVRVNGGSETRSAGASLKTGESPQVTVAVRAGYCEVGTNGDAEPVEADWRVVLRPGSPVERSRIWEDELFRSFMENDKRREILPGFFSGEAGVYSIRLFGWNRLAPHEHELVVSDNEAASVASWIVFEVALKQASALELIMTRPLRDKPGVTGHRAEGHWAQETVVKTPVVPAGRRVVAIPLDSLANATPREIPIRADRSRLVRMRLRASNDKNALEIKASLWSARPPATASEVIK